MLHWLTANLNIDIHDSRSKLSSPSNVPDFFQMTNDSRCSDQQVDTIVTVVNVQDQFVKFLTTLLGLEVDAVSAGFCSVFNCVVVHLVQAGY